MKLDSYLLREAASRGDEQEILNIFSKTFPRILDMWGEDWEFAVAPWMSSSLLLRTPRWTYCYKDGRYFIDRNYHSLDCSYLVMLGRGFYEVSE